MGWLKSLIAGVLIELLKKIWAAILERWTEWQRKQKRQNQQQKKASEFEKVVQDPTSDIEERAGANADAINSGRNP